MKYKKIQVKKFEIGIDKDEQYGYFEHSIYGDDLGGGLWFEEDILVDFDGAYVLPTAVADGILMLGFYVNKDEFCV